MSNQEQKYRLTGDSFKANPFPTFAQMRKEEPLYRLETGGQPAILWVVTNHEYSEAILRDHKRFVKRWAAGDTNRTLTRADFQAIGGVEGSLRQKAEMAMSALAWTSCSTRPR